MRSIIFLAALFSISITGHSATIHVPADYPTIQEAINAAVDNDTVLVGPDTYKEHIDFLGKAITVMSSDGPGATIIEGSQSKSVVTFKSGESWDSVLEGFTITNSTGYSTGGGISCDMYSSPTIMHNTITANTAGTGGGIDCREYSSPLIIENTIVDNLASNGGGGIFCYNSASPTIRSNLISNNLTHAGAGGVGCGKNCLATILNNTISDNLVMTDGGGVWIVSSFVTVMGNKIYGNSTISGSGGGIFCMNNPAPMIINNMIYENDAGLFFGGGGVCLHASSPVLINNTVTLNEAEILGGGFLCTGSSPIISNSIIWDNDADIGLNFWIGHTEDPSTLTISYSDVEGGLDTIHIEPGSSVNWGPGMIDANPLFVDATHNDYHLTYPSPCRDAGDNAAPGLIDTDFEGDPRIAYGSVDMGADEFYTHLYYTGDPTPGGKIQIKVTDTPSTAPVILWVGSGILQNPLATPYGDWYLQLPVLFETALSPIPATGVSVLPYQLAPDFPAPWDIPLQALSGLQLTNYSVMKAE